MLRCLFAGILLVSAHSAPASIQSTWLNVASGGSVLLAGTETEIISNSIRVMKQGVLDVLPNPRYRNQFKEIDLAEFGECKQFARVAVKSGKWSEQKTWALGAVPLISDSTCIPKGINLVLDGMDLQAREVQIYGIVSNGRVQASLRVANSIVVNPGGSFLVTSLPGTEIDLKLLSEFVIVNNGTFSISHKAASTIHLQCKAMSVRNQGRLVVQAPFLSSKVDFVFDGSADIVDSLKFSQSELNIGVNFIAATDGGVITLRGASVGRNWLKLSQTASMGSVEIYLNESAPSSWRPGNSLLVTASGFRSEESEVAIIERISGNRVILKSPLQYSHYGNLQQYPTPWDANVKLDERSEVSLLSRNIRITTHSDAPSGMGAQVFATLGSVLQMFYVEVYKGGHTNKLMRYSVHMHLLASTTPKQIVQGCSIWRSNNRCIVLHRTQDTMIQENVCFDTLGHAVFMENGIETGNVFVRNLVVMTRPSNLHSFDKEPSSFWITNQNNSFYGNVASGSTDTGFWWLGLTRPLNADSNLNIEPRISPFGAFVGNEAHTVRMAFRFDEGINSNNQLIPGGTAPYLNNGFQTITMIGAVAHHITDQAFWVRLGTRHNGWSCLSCIVADVGIGYRLFSNYLLFNNLVIGRTENTGCDQETTWNSIGSVLPVRRCSPSLGLDEYVGFMIYDGPVLLDGVHFCKFCGSSCTSRSFAIGDSIAIVKSTSHQARRISFDSDLTRNSAFFFFSTAIASWWTSTIIDLDGSLSGKPSSIIIPRINTPEEKPGDKNFVIETGPALPVPYTASNFPFVWNREYNDDPASPCTPFPENAMVCKSRRGLLKFTEMQDRLVWANYTRSDGYKMTAVFGFFSQTSVWLNRNFAYGIELWGRMPEFGIILSDVKPKEYVYFRVSNLVQPVNVILRKPDGIWAAMPLVSSLNLEKVETTSFAWENANTVLIKMIAEQYHWIDRLGSWRKTYEYSGIADVCIIKDLANIGTICDQYY